MSSPFLAALAWLISSEQPNRGCLDVRLVRTWNEASASMKPANQELDIKGDVSRGRTTRFSKGS